MQGRKYTTKKLLSDHMPFSVRDKNGSLILTGWNILCQMNFNTEWKYFNNGFICSNETKEQYENRLLHIAAKMNVLTKEANPAFICLQECPETVDTRTHFLEALKQHQLQKYDIKLLNNDTDGYYLITLYDRERYSIIDDLSKKMMAMTLSEGLKDRILPLVFSSNKTGEMILVVNVHADFTKNVQQDVKSLYQGASELGIHNVILLGDFNRDLVDKSDDYSKHDISELLGSDSTFANGLHVKAMNGTSFCTKYDSNTEQKGQGLETRDGAIATFPIEIGSMFDINSPDMGLSFTKLLSPHLGTIPHGILNKLTKESETAYHPSVGS